MPDSVENLSIVDPVELAGSGTSPAGPLAFNTPSTAASSGSARSMAANGTAAVSSPVNTCGPFASRSTSRPSGLLRLTGSPGRAVRA